MDNIKNDSNQINFKRIRYTNSIVIGGMIAMGKTTLAEAIIKYYPKATWVPEFDPDDQLCQMLLKKMYERDDNNMYASLFQLYFVIKRFDNYKRHVAKNKQMTIFDRSIFEDWLFAKENLNSSYLFGYYEGTFRGIANEIVYDIGVPKLYVILKGNWDLFKRRIYERGRPAEIDNFEKNEIYFHRLLNQYEEFLISTCKNFAIAYVIVDANLEVEEKAKIVVEKLKEIDSEQ
ncbi:MAG: deoxynucleoside kinase [Malacoplasma sp.]|nr:deoxynucleoside kinase [Malacoplasma sp.]